MTVCKASTAAWPALALMLSACAEKPAQVLSVRPVVSQCPAFPMPPAELMKRPVITDFLQTSD